MCEQLGTLGWIGRPHEFIEHFELYSDRNFWFIDSVQRPLPLNTAVMANDVQDHYIFACDQPQMHAGRNFAVRPRRYRIRTINEFANARKDLLGRLYAQC